MTFMVTILCVEATRPYENRTSPLLVEPVVMDDQAWARAGNIEVLARYAGYPARGIAYYLMLDEDGYKTSNSFFHHSDDAEELAYFTVSPSMKSDVARVLQDLLFLSPQKTIVFIAEDNGHVTDPDLTYEEIETIERLGPVDLQSFWHLVDDKRIREDSLTIVRIDEGARYSAF